MKERTSDGTFGCSLPQLAVFLRIYAVYRSAFSEDREELAEKVPDGGFRELRLRRLV
jgi:hypothetical protein